MQNSLVATRERGKRSDNALLNLTWSLRVVIAVKSSWLERLPEAGLTPIALMKKFSAAIQTAR
jgi:hypothetical protein